MEIFEFIMALQSIIIGLAMAEVLSGLARVIRFRRSQPPSWIHGLLTIGLLISLIQLWWESWTLRAVPEWSAPALLLFLSTPVLTYVLAHLLFPEPGTRTSLEHYYFQNASILWAIIGMAHVCAAAFRPLFFDAPLFVFENISSFLTVAVAILLASVRSPALHKTMGPLIFAAVLFDLFTGEYSISAGP